MGGPGSGRKKGSKSVSSIKGNRTAPPKLRKRIMKFDPRKAALNGAFGATAQRRALGYK